MSYDAQKLLDKLKVRGLDLAEDAAIIVVNEVLDWAAESAVTSENKIDDVIGSLIPVLKPVIMEQIDKIDGEKG